MDKKASLINKAFVALDVKDGVDQMAKGFSQPNKYDIQMGTDLQKNTKLRPDELNSEISADENEEGEEKESTDEEDLSECGTTASEIIDNLFEMEKQASPKDIFRRLDMDNTRYIKSMTKAIAKKDYKNAAKFAAKASKFTIPAVATSALIGHGVGKAVEKTQEKKYKKSAEDDNINARKNDYLPGIASGAVTASLLINALANKGFSHTSEEFARNVKKGAAKAPLKGLSNSGPTGKAASKFLKKFIKDLGKNASEEIDFLSKYASKKDEADILSGLFKKKQNKQAFDGIKNIFKKKEQPETLGHALKRIGKENFFMKGVTSIPYYIAPAFISYMVGRDINKGFEKIHTDRESKLTKQASILIDTKPKKFAIKNLERAAEGVGRALFPATVTAITGRNITKNMQKLQDQDEMFSNQDGMANIIINLKTDALDHPNKVKRTVNKEISKKVKEHKEQENELKKQESAIKKQASDNAVDITEIVKQIKDELRKERGIQQYVRTSKPYITNGMKKQVRMKK